jgi:hypothetical protein
MYTHLLPGLAAERGRDIRQDAVAASLTRLARVARPGHRARRVIAAAKGPESRLVPRTARP